jgi:hypothetical protein
MVKVEKHVEDELTRMNAEAQRRREERNETEIQTETACLLTN